MNKRQEAQFARWCAKEKIDFDALATIDERLAALERWRKAEIASAENDLRKSGDMMWEASELRLAAACTLKELDGENASEARIERLIKDGHKDKVTVLCSPYDQMRAAAAERNRRLSKSARRITQGEVALKRK